MTSSLLSKNIKIKIYTSINLSVVLYGYETWSLTLREKRRLMLFENRVLRRIFSSKRVEMKGECRKLNNGELNDVYFSTNIVRVIKSRIMRWAEHVASMGRVEVYTGFLVGNWEERGYLKDATIDGSVVLSRMFREWVREHGLD